MANCKIVFDQNEHGTYFTGQVITGKVIFDFKKPKKLKGIKLQICGFAFCQWREKHGKAVAETKKSRKSRKFFSGREDYISSTTYLAGSEDGAQFHMDAGTHTYKFACPIPFNCPSSYEGSFGHIRYVAKVTTYKHGSSKKTHVVGFTVLKLLDLNQETHLLKAPCSNEALENFCLFNSKPIQLNVSIQQSGFVPGQLMQVTAHIRNESSVNCQKVLMILNLRATYTADSPHMKTTSEKICLVTKPLGPCPGQSEKTYTDSIRIPATPPTCEHLSKCVRVSYEVCVVAVMNHFMRNPKATIPITIGNIPLVNSAGVRIDDVPTTSSCAMRIVGEGQHNLLSEQIQVREETESEDDYIEEGEELEDGQGTSFQVFSGEDRRTLIEMPPPTYEEAMHMTRNIAENEDTENPTEEAQFTPVYPIFNVDIINSITPPPNPPQKRRRRKKKDPEGAPTTTSTTTPSTMTTPPDTEKPSFESLVQI